jgi:glycosyltransferase involved in cell wall biosynthesis
MKILFIGENIDGISTGIITIMKQLLGSEYLSKNVHYQPIFTTGSHFPLYRKLTSWARAYSVFFYQIWSSDIVHIHHASNLNFWLSSKLVIIAKFLKKKTILHNHAGDFETFYQSCSVVDQKRIVEIFNSASVNIVVSNSWLQWYRAIAPRANWVVMPNSIELPIDVPEKTLIDQGGTLIYLARIEEKKGFFTLINIMPQVLQQFPNCKLYVAGQGDLIAAEKLLAEKGLTNHVVLMGHIDSEQRDKLLRKGHLLVFPSFHEGLPMALLEAMAYGLVPVTTPVGGIPEVVIHGYNGVLVSPGNEEELFKGIESLLSDKINYQKMSIRANDKIVREFNLLNYQEKLLSVYHSIS